MNDFNSDPEKKLTPDDLFASPGSENSPYGEDEVEVSGLFIIEESAVLEEEEHRDAVPPAPSNVQEKCLDEVMAAEQERESSPQDIPEKRRNPYLRKLHLPHAQKEEAREEHHQVSILNILGLGHNDEDEAKNTSKLHFGNILREARTEQGLSLSELEEKVKIRSHYIEALESDDFSKLPPAVYAIAYLKKLCAFFQIAPATTEMMLNTVRERLEYSMPEEMSKVVLDHEVSEENSIRLRRIVWGLAVVGIGMVSLVALALFLFMGRGDEEQLQTMQNQGMNQAAQFNPDAINAIIGKESLNTSIVRVPGNR